MISADCKRSHWRQRPGLGLFGSCWNRSNPQRGPIMIGLWMCPTAAWNRTSGRILSALWIVKFGLCGWICSGTSHGGPIWWDQNCLETTLCSSGLRRAVCVSGRAAVLAAIGVNNKRDMLMSSAAHFLHAEPFQRYISVFTWTQLLSDVARFLRSREQREEENTEELNI